MVKVKVKNMNNGHVYKVKKVKTIGDIKTNLEEHHGIPSGSQIFIYKDIMQPDDGMRLKNLVMVKYDLFELYFKIPAEPIRTLALEIYSELDNEMFDFHISSDETVLSLKKRIDKELGLSPYRQHLTHVKGEMDDDYLVRDYIYDESKPPLIMVRFIPRGNSLKIYIQIVSEDEEEEEEDKVMTVNPKDTIYRLHGDARRLELARGHEFYFVFEGEQLDGERTFEYYNIQNNDILTLVNHNNE